MTHTSCFLAGNIETKMSTEDEFDQLTHSQRLKAAVHHTTLRICREHVQSKGVKLNRLVVASISETTWRKCEEFATYLELFAKHAKRTTVNADDVKLLVQKSPKLLNHINSLHEQLNISKGETKKRTKKGKNTSSSTVASSRGQSAMDIDEDSRS